MIKPLTSTENAIAGENCGFNYGGKTIRFIEPKGKDISFARWRICLYYTPHNAETAFFDTREAYDSFIAEARKFTFADYSDYRKWSDGQSAFQTNAAREAGHTPGPWFHAGGSIGNSDKLIAMLPAQSGKCGIPKNEADARLIAAAPDLLAAVIYAEAMAEIEIDDLRKIWDEDSMPVQAAIIAREKYRAALTKGGAK